MKSLLLLPLLAGFLLAVPAVQAAPLGLYTTLSAEKGEPVPVGFNEFTRSGFLLRVGPGWRLADPVLPLDFTYLKPWIETRGGGTTLRIRRLRIDTADLAVAARRDRPPGTRGLERLATTPFPTAGGLTGLRVAYGTGRTVLFTATYFDNRKGDLFSFDATVRDAGQAKAVDGLLGTLALERRRDNRR